jgi:hypothetical protein
LFSVSVANAELRNFASPLDATPPGCLGSVAFKGVTGFPSRGADGNAFAPTNEKTPAGMLALRVLAHDFPNK